MSAAGPPPLSGVDGPLVDAHAHSWSPELSGDRPGVLARAWEAGLRAIVEAGVDAETSAAALRLARSESRVHAAAGLHPHSASRLDDEREALEALVAAGAASGELAAVGEIGLDYYRGLSPRPDQERALGWQLGLAREVGLPVVVHARGADEECYEQLRAWAVRSGRYLGPDREIGMMHCFAGDSELARRYVELGFLVSIPGTVTYPGNARGRAVARELALAAMLVETDCPYLAPVPHRGRPNEPAYVAYTVREIAALRGESERGVARATSENAARLFGFTLVA